MKHIHILCIASPHIFEEFIVVLSDCFTKRGHRVTIENAFKKDPELPYSKDINIIMKAQRLFHPSKLPRKAFNILMQTEQFSKLRQFSSKPHSEPWDLILDLFKSNIEEIRNEITCPVEFLPIGYHKGFASPQDNEVKKEIDCYFFGARTKYRQRIWRECVLPVSSNSIFDNQILGEEKHERIRKSKINIFIDGWTPYYLPMLHCMQILANGEFLLVITENMHQDFSPHLPWEHFFAVPPNRAKEEIKRFLGKDEFRYRFSKKSFEDLKMYYKMEDILFSILERYIDV